MKQMNWKLFNFIKSIISPVSKGIISSTIILSFIVWNIGFSYANWEGDIRDIFSNWITELNKKQEKVYSKKYNVSIPTGNESSIKNGLQLQSDEMNRIIQEKSLKMDKILSEKGEQYNQLNADYVTFLWEYESDKSSGDMWVFVIVWMGQWELVNVNNSSVYILPYKSIWDDKWRAYILKKLEEKKNNLDEFQNTLWKFGVNAIVARPTVDYEFFLWEKNEIKKSITMKLFSSAEYSITEPTVKNFLKEKSTLYYFGYIPAIKMEGAFWPKTNIRASDMFLQFWDKPLYLGLYDPNKKIPMYFSSLVKTEDGILYYYSYSYDVFAQYYTIIFILLGLVLAYFSALWFLNKQKMVISLIDDKI